MYLHRFQLHVPGTGTQPIKQRKTKEDKSIYNQYVIYSFCLYLSNIFRFLTIYCYYIVTNYYI